MNGLAIFSRNASTFAIYYLINRSNLLKQELQWSSPSNLDAFSCVEVFLKTVQLDYIFQSRKRTDDF